MTYKNHKIKVLNRIRSFVELVAFAILILPICNGQEYDLLIKRGHVIDVKNHIDGMMDLAIKDGKVALVSKNISTDQSKKIIEANGLYITPGLIDIHTHVFVGHKTGQFAGGFSSVSPDDFTLKSGVTTVVDAGTSGWRNFPEFKKSVIDQSQTRILAFLNISGHGMMGGPFEQDLTDMDSKLTSLVIKQYPSIIVGTKVGHFSGKDWTPFDRALQAGKIADVPLLVECHLPELPLERILVKLRPGDIFTHAFGEVDDRNSILDEKGMVSAHVLSARDKGIHFDVGHGGGSFHFSIATPALRQGFFPDSFGTDLHRFSMNAGMKDMLNIMSKYLNMGMTLSDIIYRATWSPAQIIKRTDLGHLSVGAMADLAILKLDKGSFGFVDADGYKIDGDRKFVAEMTIRAGRIVWDLNGLGAKKYRD